mmetsp:Transcript_49118/g.105683  ORF Transcript_49118/g.105683 Transcript_49118/m.105683 type:complete len:437 (+) Transcript_49118:73-1383(+)
MEVVVAVVVGIASIPWLWKHLPKSLRREKVEEHPHEWLFSALAHIRKDIVEKGDPDMNWNEIHPKFGTPLHAIGSHNIDLEVEGWPYYDWSRQASATIKDLLALFKFALRRGADPNLICPRTCTGAIRLCVGELYTVSEPIAGRSPISVWLALSQKLQDKAPENECQLPLGASLCDSILSLLLNNVPKHRGLPPRKNSMHPAMVSLPESTTSMWQRIMNTEESADVTLRCPDGEAFLHSIVVTNASRVLAAMVRWPRQDDASSSAERRPQLVVEVEEPKQVVEAWKLMVYTGLPPQEQLQLKTLLQVLQLSHRWQDHLWNSGLLVAAVKRRLQDSESCLEILESALATDIPSLRDECLAYARRSRDVQRSWQRGDLSEPVARELDRVFAHLRIDASRVKGSSPGKPSGGLDEDFLTRSEGEIGAVTQSPEAGRWDL